MNRQGWYSRWPGAVLWVILYLLVCFALWSGTDGSCDRSADAAPLEAC